ncbi:MAG: hypothetical protein HQL79_07630 [Magnetococcales bacterium]|nr:hypothetical protein [Magnetococcales bacterium]
MMDHLWKRFNEHRARQDALYFIRDVPGVTKGMIWAQVFPRLSHKQLATWLGLMVQQGKIHRDNEGRYRPQM